MSVSLCCVVAYNPMCRKNWGMHRLPKLTAMRDEMVYAKSVVDRAAAEDYDED